MVGSRLISLCVIFMMRRLALLILSTAIVAFVVMESLPGWGQLAYTASLQFGIGEGQDNHLE